MKFFLDSAKIKEIEDCESFGIIDGVTTNPSLIAHSGHNNLLEVVKNICGIMSHRPVSVEVVSVDYSNMLKEAEKLASLADNVVVKLPCTDNGIKVCSYLSKHNIKTNITLCFSALQALVAAKVGATYISPFVGRLDDIHQDGLNLISEIRNIYDNYNFKTEILAASIRNHYHLLHVAKIGADIATISPQILKTILNHPLTSSGLEKFIADWENSGQNLTI